MGLGGIIDLIDNSEPILCYWAMWESARYCMLSRLRTPFGGPQQVSKTHVKCNFKLTYSF